MLAITHLDSRHSCHQWWFHGIWLSISHLRALQPSGSSSTSAIVIMIAILYIPGLSRLPLSARYAILILQGFCCNGLVLGYCVGHDVGPPGSAGISVGFVNTICVRGTAIFLPILGWLSTLKEQPDISHGIHAVTVGDYRFALTFLIVALGIAIVAAPRSKHH